MTIHVHRLWLLPWFPIPDLERRYCTWLELGIMVYCSGPMSKVLAWLAPNGSWWQLKLSVATTANEHVLLHSRAAKFQRMTCVSVSWCTRPPTSRKKGGGVCPRFILSTGGIVYLCIIIIKNVVLNGEIYAWEMSSVAWKWLKLRDCHTQSVTLGSPGIALNLPRVACVLLGAIV